MTNVVIEKERREVREGVACAGETEAWGVVNEELTCKETMRTIGHRVSNGGAMYAVRGAVDRTVLLTLLSFSSLNILGKLELNTMYVVQLRPSKRARMHGTGSWTLTLDWSSRTS